MRLKNNQNGFGVIEGLLTIIALTLIVGVGFYVFNANKDDTKESVSTTQSSSDKKETTQEPKVDYVEFKDLGFKIKKTDKMADWMYLSDNEAPMSKYVQSAAHVKQIDTCNQGTPYPPLDDPSSKSFAAFSRVDGTFANTTGLEKLAKQFDTFYISISYPNGGSPCTNEKGVGYPVNRSPEGAHAVLLEALENAEKL